MKRKPRESQVALPPCPNFESTTEAGHEENKGCSLEVEFAQSTSTPALIPSAKALIKRGGNQPLPENPNNELEPFAKSDNLVSLEQLGVQINDFHAKAVANEEAALKNIWESGTRLNRAYDRVYDEEGYGAWGDFLKEKCPKISRTTAWRYRKIASGFTMEQLAGMTLSEAYANLGISDFQEEPVEDDADANDVGAKRAKKTKSAVPKLFKDVVKASAKFDVPVTMSKTEKSAVKKLGTQLETVYGQAIKPSILGFVWQEQVDKEVDEWTPEEIELFEGDFAKLQAVHEKVRAIKGEA